MSMRVTLLLRHDELARTDRLAGLGVAYRCVESTLYNDLDQLVLVWPDGRVDSPIALGDHQRFAYQAQRLTVDDLRAIEAQADPDGRARVAEMLGEVRRHEEALQLYGVRLAATVELVGRSSKDGSCAGPDNDHGLSSRPDREPAGTCSKGHARWNT